MLLHVGWERDADGLEDTTDLASDGGTGGDAFAVLFDGGLLQAVEIAQQVAPFDGDIGGAGDSWWCCIPNGDGLDARSGVTRVIGSCP